jgi:hypothetical protein
MPAVSVGAGRRVGAHPRRTLPSMTTDDRIALRDVLARVATAARADGDEGLDDVRSALAAAMGAMRGDDDAAVACRYFLGRTVAGPTPLRVGPLIRAARRACAAALVPDPSWPQARAGRAEALEALTRYHDGLGRAASGG